MSTPRAIRQARRAAYCEPDPLDDDDEGDVDLGDEGTFSEPWESGPCERAADAASDRYQREIESRWP